MDIIKKILKKFFHSGLVGKILSSLSNARWESKYNGYRNKYSINSCFSFKGVGIDLYGEGEIILGENSYIGNYSTIQAYKNQKVTIGENSSISHNVRIYTCNRNADDIISNNKNIGFKTGDVLIGSNTWIGANVFIVEGVNIGHNCVIGANSVVTKSVPNNCIAAGNPAIVIKKLEK